MKALLSNISNSIDFILKLFLILLSIEVFMSLYPMLKDIENNMLTFRSMDYKGAAANINISSFSILYKIPILLYFLTKEKNLLVLDPNRFIYDQCLHEGIKYFSVGSTYTGVDKL